jgi:hypothetical protein
VRKHEAGFTENQVTVEEKVEIEGAWATGNGEVAIAAEGTLDVKEGGKEFARRVRDFESYNGVEKVGLVGESDGSGGVER